MFLDLIRDNIDEVKDDEKIIKLLKKDAELGITDFYHFCKYILGYKEMEIEPHKELCDFVTDPKGKNKKLIMMPRGSFKSSVVTIGFSIYAMILNPNIRILIASEKLSNAQKFLAEIKGHLERNDYFRALYGKMDESKDESCWNNSEIIVSTRTKVLKEPTISTAGVDVTKVGMHYDLIIVDDPVSRSNVGTKEQIDKVFEWYRLLLSLLDPKKKLVVIGTRWSYADLYGTLQEEPHSDMFDFHIRAAEYMEDDKVKLLFPNRLTREFLNEQKRIQGSRIYSCQYQNQPIAEEDAIFKPDNFRYYIEDDIKRLTLNKFMCVDPAISLEENADFTVFMIVGVDQNNNIYILHIDRGKYLPNEIVKKFLDYAKRYSTLANGLETVAFQKTLKYQLNDRMREDGDFVDVTELKGNRTISKELRVQALQPRYEQNSVFHLKNSLQTAELEYELMHFPKAKHDDMVDCLASLLEIIYAPTNKNKKKKKRKALCKRTGW